MTSLVFCTCRNKHLQLNQPFSQLLDGLQSIHAETQHDRTLERCQRFAQQRLVDERAVPLCLIKKLTLRSTAVRISPSMAYLSGGGPEVALMPMQTRPRAVTSRVLFPS